MSFEPRFFRALGLSALAAALLVLVAQLILGSYPRPAGFDSLIELYAQPMVRVQQVVILVQVFLMFLGLWGVVAKVHRRSPGAALTALLLLCFWQMFELIPRSLELFAGSWRYAPAFVSAADETGRETARVAMRTLLELTNAMGDVRRILWLLSHLLLAIALWSTRGWGRWLAILFFANALRLALGMAGSLLGQPSLGGGLAGFMVLIVPQFLMIAAWLWTNPVVEPLSGSERREES